MCVMCILVHVYTCTCVYLCMQNLVWIYECSHSFADYFSMKDLRKCFFSFRIIYFYMNLFTNKCILLKIGSFVSKTES